MFLKEIEDKKIVSFEITRNTVTIGLADGFLYYIEISNYLDKEGNPYLLLQKEEYIGEEVNISSFKIFEE